MSPPASPGRSLTLDAATGRVAIRFEYDARLVGLVREIPGRRWDPTRRMWLAPLEALSEVAALLSGEGFFLDEELRGRLGPAAHSNEVESNGRAGPVEEPLTSVGEVRGPERSPAALAHISVGELNARVREAIRGRFPRALWVVGEVTGFDRNAHKDHVFFELVEKREQDGSALAQVTAVLFAGSRGRVLGRLREGAARLELQDGLEVRVQVRVDLFPRTGTYQVVVEDVDPAYTLGALALHQERILGELERRGVRDHNLALAHPILPLRVALITSWESDAANDVLAELRGSGYGFAVDLWDVTVQGPHLEASVGAALDGIARRGEDYDVCLICRGGGGRADLAWFDNLEIALRVAQLPLKVVCGIGHHRDVSVLDRIAYAEKTPTAAAQYLVAQVASQEVAVQEAAEALVRRAESTLRESLQRLQWSTDRLLQIATRSQRQAATGLDERGRRLARAGTQALWRARARLHDIGALTTVVARSGWRDQHAQLDRQRERLGRGAAVAIARAGERLVAAAQQTDAHDPRRVLARGYAILRAEGRALRDSSEVEPGQVVRARLHRGTLKLRVESSGSEPGGLGEVASSPTAGPGKAAPENLVAEEEHGREEQ